MTLLIDGFVNATIILAGIYFFLSLLAAQKLNWLHKKSSELNTRKLFVMSCFLTCILRCMSFASISILNFGNYDIDTSSADGNMYSSDLTVFFDKAFIVLFDFPDFPCISAYMLLSMVWAEAYFQSRRHWLSSLYFRQVWMIAYLVFNILLYSTQISLYSLLFFPSIDQTILTDLIYLTLSTINIVMPILWLLVYFYLTVMFSGFPFSSLDAQLRLASLGRLATIWTVARFCWGIIDLTSVVEGWMVQVEKSEVSYSIILIAIFLLTEVTPMVMGLLSRSLQSLSEEQQQDEEISVWNTQRSTTNSSPNINPIKKKLALGESDDDLDYASAHEGSVLHSHNNSTKSTLMSTTGRHHSSSQDMRRFYNSNNSSMSGSGNVGSGSSSTGNLENENDADSALLWKPVSKKHWLIRLFGIDQE